MSSSAFKRQRLTLGKWASSTPANFNMTIQEFSLKPFRSSQETVSTDITGKISRQAEHLSVTYELLGALPTVVVPQPVTPPTRQDNLWQTTCFECFLRPANGANYWEFNLSPSYAWNAYTFRDYRQDRHPSQEIESLPFQILQTPTVLQLVWSFDLSQVSLADQNLRVAIAAVVEFQNGPLTYWALTHPAADPDFHHRGSFMSAV